MSELLIFIMPFYLTEDLFVVVVLNTCKYSWTPAICSSVIMDSPIHFFCICTENFVFLKKNILQTVCKFQIQSLQKIKI